MIRTITNMVRSLLFFRLLFLPITGSRRFMVQFTSSLLMKPCTARPLPILTYMSSGAYVTRIPLLPPLISFLLAPRLTCFSATLPPKRGFAVVDLSSGRLIISRHVIFNEGIFPFATPLPVSPAPPPEVDPLHYSLSTLPPDTPAAPTRAAPSCAPTSPAPPSSPVDPQPAALTHVPLCHPAAPVVNYHPMTTRGKSGILKPRLPLSLSLCFSWSRLSHSFLVPPCPSGSKLASSYAPRICCIY